MTHDELHDTRGYLGPCAICGADMWQGDDVVEMWTADSDTPQWAHETHEEDGVYKPGDSVNWVYEHRGGYGYTSVYAATVVKVTPKRVTIEVTSKLTGKPVQKVVKPESLRQAAWRFRGSGVASAPRLVAHTREDRDDGST